MKKIHSYIKLLRPSHYIKNILILLPLIFSQQFIYIEKVSEALLGMISFCFLASVVYIINDIKDIEKDRKHPIKKNRPLASGEITIFNGIVIAIILFVLSIGCIVFSYLKYQINIELALTYLLIYLILNIFYSFGLKNFPIIDIIILVSGFLIRVLFGGVVIQVDISGWLYLTIISISFYLGLGKRRNELVNYKEKETRGVLKYYTKEFLDKNMYVCLTLSIAFYALWAMNYTDALMLWTIPLIMILAMKYSYDIEVMKSEGDPVEVLLHDKWIMILGMIYTIFVLSIIYFK